MLKQIYYKLNGKDKLDWGVLKDLDDRIEVLKKKK